MSTREPRYFALPGHNGWDEYGRPNISIVGNAIQFWAMQTTAAGLVPSVRNAALAFHCEDEMIRQAVSGHYWMFVSGPDDDATKQIIEHEGE